MSDTTEPKRAPLLSVETLTIIGLKAAETKYGLHEQCMAIAAAISGAYEAKITKGELMVVKTARLVKRDCIRPFASGPMPDVAIECSQCGTEETHGMGSFCRWCGAKIIEG